ncbi:hypothetical protein [Corynebacterium sp. UMB2355A]|uniref:hypothetical protein n=1 Tax=Corynebacterium sp. UMB2355A TaxID=3081222 RepID=UPI0029FEF4F7|nr:hypothetical protein [Corynebacterium sp. UMB2355A]WPJ93302.1 hypothetical protein R0V12_02765 [Corynebacterium sp. UMB2355A]
MMIPSVNQPIDDPLGSVPPFLNVGNFKRSNNSAQRNYRRKDWCRGTDCICSGEVPTIDHHGSSKYTQKDEICDPQTNLEDRAFHNPHTSKDSV